MNWDRAWALVKKTACAASWYCSFQTVRTFRAAFLRWENCEVRLGWQWGGGRGAVGLSPFNLKKPNILSHLLLLYCFVPHSCHSLHPVEHELYEGNEYLSSLPADADRAEDFEYEVRSWAHFTLSFCYYRYGIYTADSRLLWEKEEYEYFFKIITKASFMLYLCDVTGFTGVRLKMWNFKAELCSGWLHTSLGGLLNMFFLCAVETASQMLLF